MRGFSLGARSFSSFGKNRNAHAAYTFSRRLSKPSFYYTWVLQQGSATAENPRFINLPSIDLVPACKIAFEDRGESFVPSLKATMNRTVPNDRSTLRQLASTFFVLVLLVFATAQLIHAHNPANPDSPKSESHCLLCVASHSAAAPAQVSIAPITFNYLTFQAASEPQLHSRLSVPPSFIRPPPENL
jgi:hypothetical protein